MQMSSSSAACIANIGPQGRRKRLVSGIVALAVGVVIAVLCVVAGVRPLLRLPIFVPLFVAGLGFFQARDRTWVRLASRGLRDMDTGEERIVDAGEAEKVRRQARAVYVKSFIAAAILTALALLPWYRRLRAHAQCDRSRVRRLRRRHVTQLD
jgi:hypothetical protein